MLPPTSVGANIQVALLVGLTHELNVTVLLLSFAHVLLKNRLSWVVFGIVPPAIVDTLSLQ